MLITSLIASQESKEDKVVAQVNDTIIKNSELMKTVNVKMSKNFFHGGIPDAKLLDFKKKTLTTLIDRELIYQYALKNKFVLTQKELLEEEAKIVEAFGGNENFQSALKRNQMSYEFFKSELIKESANAIVYRKKIEQNFTDEDLEKYYEENKYKFKKPESINVQLIYIKNNPKDANGTQISDKLAKEAYSMIKDGEDFGQVAKEYSDDKSRINNGVIKNLHKGMIDQSVENEAFKLDIGEVSEIIKKPIGSYIVKVLSKKVEHQLEYEDIEGKLKKDLKKSREKKLLENLLEEIRKDSVITNYLEIESKEKK